MADSHERGPAGKRVSRAHMEGTVRTRSPEHGDTMAPSTSRTNRAIPSYPSGSSPSATGRPNHADTSQRIDSLDPLSQHIQKRTNAQNVLPSRMRTAAALENETVTSRSSEPSASIPPARTDAIEPAAARQASPAPAVRDKKQRGSFFSRFAPKKKDSSADPKDDASEGGARRTEGMDADVFSQPIGYVPQFPPPPKYIKVRSHNKKDKDFNRVFLAQELRGRTGVEIAQRGGRLVKENGLNSSDRKDGNAIWAVEFSKDGKHLAAGGKDYVVRVWALLSTREERHTHEMEEDAAGKDGESIRLNAPVFKTKPAQEYSGHTASVLDLSWSKNNFLLSSSMDKTVRLWHVSRDECLCCFKHSDFVTSIQFHPRDDRFFLAGSLDSKLRLWSIPDKSVAYCVSSSDLITAVTFSPDGKTAVAGCLNGMCSFYETEGLKHQTQIHVRSAHGKNAKGSKITGLQAINYPVDDPSADVKLLVTSNDSRVRVYNIRNKGLELKLKGNENSCSQIHASFSDDANYIICGSEDRKVYIWSTEQPETDKDKRPVEIFEAHSAIVTTAILAPTKSRRLLSASGDPLYDLCNPPPITLVSRSQSHQSSLSHPTDDSHGKRVNQTQGSSAPSESGKITTKPEESPAYLARCAHSDGNIIVTADFDGHIKVFRQDCAYQNRTRNNDSALSKKMLGRASSVATRHSSRSQRESLPVNNNSSDRILSWRQSIHGTTGSLESFRNPNANGNGAALNHKRSQSPRKSIGQASIQSAQTTNRYPQYASNVSTPYVGTTSSSPDHSPQEREPTEPPQDQPGEESDALKVSQASAKTHNMSLSMNDTPLMLRGEQSYMFWNRSVYQAQAAAAAKHLDPHSADPSIVGSSNASADGEHHGAAAHLGVPLAKEITTVSRLSSEEGSIEDLNGGEARSKHEDPDDEVACKKCAQKSFRVRSGSRGRIVECANCGTSV